MPETLPSETLAAQHREIDAGIKGGVDASGARAALTNALALLRKHLYVEEAALFPPLVATGLAMPVFVMKREHGQMWPLIATLEKSCAAGTAMADLREPCRQLFQLLQMHNPKEEQIVYTAADRLAKQQGDGALATAIATAKMPDGWTCAMGTVAMGMGLGKAPTAAR